MRTLKYISRRNRFSRIKQNGGSILEEYELNDSFVGK
jgi:hypothetical protein